MEKFVTHVGIVAPLEYDNIDTDQIIPKQFLLSTSKKGFGKYLFHDLRYLDDHQKIPNPEFCLNQPKYQHASILVSYENFGSGSSREHAPWALTDFGIRAILAPSFADIFKNNALTNGLLTIELPKQEIEWIITKAKSADVGSMKICLLENKVNFEGAEFTFQVSKFYKDCLLNGLDTIALSLKHQEEIYEYEKQSKDFLVRPKL